MWVIKSNRSFFEHQGLNVWGVGVKANEPVEGESLAYNKHKKLE